jgi:hypothetical protein
MWKEGQSRLSRIYTSSSGMWTEIYFWLSPIYTISADMRTEGQSRRSRIYTSLAGMPRKTTREARSKPQKWIKRTLKIIKFEPQLHNILVSLSPKDLLKRSSLHLGFRESWKGQDKGWRTQEQPQSPKHEIRPNVIQIQIVLTYSFSTLWWIFAQ